MSHKYEVVIIHVYYNYIIVHILYILLLYFYICVIKVIVHPLFKLMSYASRSCTTRTSSASLGGRLLLTPFPYPIYNIVSLTYIRIALPKFLQNYYQ